jgi:hypothetical protein
VQSILTGGAEGNVIGYMTLRPICLVLITMSLLSGLWPLYAARKDKKRRLAECRSREDSDA